MMMRDDAAAGRRRLAARHARTAGRGRCRALGPIKAAPAKAWLAGTLYPADDCEKEPLSDPNARSFGY
jgi:hypothetical protein